MICTACLREGHEAANCPREHWRYRPAAAGMSRRTRRACAALGALARRARGAGDAGGVDICRSTGKLQEVQARRESLHFGQFVNLRTLQIRRSVNQTAVCDFVQTAHSSKPGVLAHA